MASSVSIESCMGKLQDGKGAVGSLNVQDVDGTSELIHPLFSKVRKSAVFCSVARSCARILVTSISKALINCPLVPNFEFEGGNRLTREIALFTCAVHCA